MLFTVNDLQLTTAFAWCMQRRHFSRGSEAPSWPDNRIFCPHE